MNLMGKTVLITGANRGIGRALVTDALRRGAATVYAGVRTPAHFGDARVRCVTLDVTDPAQVDAAAAQVPVLDMLVNNAGVGLARDMPSLQAIELHMSVNVFGSFRVTEAFLPQLKQSRGAIVNQVSLVGLAPAPVLSAYSMSKAALLSMTQSLRSLLAGDGISVHGVILGPVDTDMNRHNHMEKAAPDVTAKGIFDAVQAGEPDIFPDPLSASFKGAWATSVSKTLERQFAGFAPTRVV